MPANDHHPQHKRPKLDSSKSLYRYSSASELRSIFTAQTESALIEGLTALRNQLTVKDNDPPIQASDVRLVLAIQWLQADPAAHDLFAAWEAANPRQTSLLAVIVAVLSALLSLLSSHYSYHSHAQPILRALLSQQWSHHLSLYLSGQHTDLVLVTLKLYNSLSNFAGGRERKAVLDIFPWDSKSLQKLLHMRRKSRSGDNADMLLRPDIRTLYILLVLSFLESTTSSSVKAIFLEQHRDAFTSIFKGLSQDSYSVIRRVLEVSWSGFWSDPKLKRTLKVQVFSEAILSQLIRIYQRSSPEGADSESIPADVVHHFLLALCSRPGVGLCFQDHGWYPRETDADKEAEEQMLDTDAPRKGSRIYNKILANVLKSLKVNEDLRQQELALRILAACPELVAGYWLSAGLALEPRLSSKWLANIAFFGAVVSLRVPTSSFFLPQSGSGSTSLYQPFPPPLSAIIENIIPTVPIKTHLSRGLQSSSPLVQHSCALALAKCLLKYEQVACALQEVENALEEDEEDGLWARRRRELEREVRRRVPEFQVIVGFSQRLSEPSPTLDRQDKGKQKVIEISPNPTRTALLSESAHRLLWLYHSLLPSVVAEARFDAGKLLQAVEDMISQGSNVSTTGGLDTLRQLHILRLLRETEHFTWSGKSGSKHSNFYILLKVFTITRIPAIRTAIVVLLRHILAPGVLFQHDADEIALWLESLPLTRRAPDAQATDGAPLTDEGDGVITFIDDCVQRCVKTPYKYVEELQATYDAYQKDKGMGHADDEGPSFSIGSRPEAFPSPLLATAVEQLAAKLRGNLLSPSDALALFSFARKLLLRIASKSVDLILLEAYGASIAALARSISFPDYPVVETAIRREGALLAVSVARLHEPAEISSPHSSPAARAFLARAEKQAESNNEQAKHIAAYELIEWIRFTGPALESSELVRLILLIGELHKSAIQELFQYLDPRQTSLWEGGTIPDALAGIMPEITFEMLFLFLTNSALEMEGKTCQQYLVDSLFARPLNVVDISRAVRLILHRLSSPAIPEVSTRALLSLLATIVDKTLSLGVADVSSIVLLSFESDVIKSLAARPLGDIGREGLSRFLDACSQVDGEDVTHVLASSVGRWALALRDSIANINEDNRATALLWFKYMNATEALNLLEYLADGGKISNLDAVQDMIRGILHVTFGTLSRDLEAIARALPLLTNLQTLLSPHTFGESPPELISLIACATHGSLPLCHDGYLPHELVSGSNVSSLLSAAGERWSLRLQPLPPQLTISPLVGRTHLSIAHVDFMLSMVYRSRAARSAATMWLASEESTAAYTTDFVRLLFAVLDASDDGQRAGLQHLDVGLSHLSRLLPVVAELDSHYANFTRDTRTKAAQCVVWMVLSSSHRRSEYLAELVRAMKALTPEKLNPYCMYIARRVWEDVRTEAAVLVGLFVELGLKWAVRHFVDSKLPTDDNSTIICNLASMVRAQAPVRGHLAEPVISTVIQDRLADKDGVQLARLLASLTSLKPITVNKFLQTIVQHAKFYIYCLVSSGGVTSRDGIIEFLHTLFHLHPNNTCQPSHIEPLRKVYGGSLSASDLRILSILELFEATRRTSVASLLSQWSMTPDVSSDSSLDAINSLDASRVLKTCLEYPEWRKLATDLESHLSSHEHLYDPVFVLLLFAQMLADNAPTSALAWVQLFRTNVVSLVIRVLSAKDIKLRDVAWAQVATLYKAIEAADLQEKAQVLYILGLLKDLTLTSSALADDTPHLPAYTTLLLAYAFRGVFYPSNFIYPLTARFLLQRPTLDPTDVPMLYGMLYSASDDWKKERAWIIRFLSDGIVGTEEWRVLKRRHTWDLLASLFQSEERDRTLRRGVLEVLANVTCHARASTSLLLRHALLAWIEMQLQTMRGDEAIAWARILENILAVANEGKMEEATNGEWRSTVARCLQTILHHPTCTHNIFVASVPVLLRLSLLPGDSIPHIHTTLTRCVSWLVVMETEVAVPSSRPFAMPPPGFNENSPVVLHHSQRLFDTPTPPSAEQWGGCVEALWRVSIAIPQKSAEWDALSSRLLVWRAIAGREGSRVGEWVRKEALV